MPANPLIEHVVIIVKENHTFDSYFGTFPGANGVTLPQHAANPPQSDLPHTHEAWLNFDTGAARAQYLEADIPAYFAYARQFTLCDNYFTDVASQSEPNHLMLIAADSPIIDNASKSRTWQPEPPFTMPSLPASLEKAGFTWRNYGGYYHQHIKGLARKFSVTSGQFDTDIDSGKLPTVSWVYAPDPPGQHGGGLSEHPTDNVTDGMMWTVARVNKVAQSAYWAKSVIFITWDDWGGWYDHVPPPLAESWTGGSPPGGNFAGTQFRYGPRVGCLVLSPYARRNHVSKTFRSHVSLVRFCEKTFGLAPLSAYDAAGDDMADCFDFTQAPGAPPVYPPPGP